MKKITLLLTSLSIMLFLQSCSTVKVLDAWKAKTTVVDIFSKKMFL